MNSYWTYEVLSIEGDKKRSLVIAPSETLAQALAGAFKDATYYIGVCGYRVAVVFHEMCKVCGGSGAERCPGGGIGTGKGRNMSSNLDKLRGILGIVGGRESEVLGIAIKRLKEQEAEIDRLNDLLAERDAGERNDERG